MNCKTLFGLDCQYFEPQLRTSGRHRAGIVECKQLRIQSTTFSEGWITS